MSYALSKNVVKNVCANFVRFRIPLQNIPAETLQLQSCWIEKTDLLVQFTRVDVTKPAEMIRTEGIVDKEWKLIEGS